MDEPEEQEERKRAGVEREYSDDRITVYWAPQFCIHTANCLNAQPDVFDAMRRPWVILEGADTDAIAEREADENYGAPDLVTDLVSSRHFWARRQEATP